VSTRGVVLLVTVLAVAPAAGWAAGAGYYQRHAEGWFWYQDPPPPREEAAQAQPEAPVRDDPVAVLEAFRRRLDTARARAILEPTEDNVKAYLELNQLALARAGDFAQAWQRVVWTTPGLDYSLAHPVNDQAVQVFNDEKVRMLDRFLRKAAARYGMFFFFSESCPYCRRFAPVLRDFADTYGFRVVPVSLDGGALPEFPNPRRNAAIAARLRVDTVPAVFLVEPRTRKIRPVAFGYVGWSELARRIYTLLEGRPPNPLLQARHPGGEP